MSKETFTSNSFLTEYKQSDVIYQYIGDDFNEGILSCGFMRKRSSEKSQYNCIIGYYSCFVLLSGEGVYINESGQEIRIKPGDVVQRMPDVCHSTKVTPDGNWLEFYISIGKSTFDYLCKLKLLHNTIPVFPTRITKDDLFKFQLLLGKLKKAEIAELTSLHFEAQKLVVSWHQNYNYPIKSKEETIMEKARQLLGNNLGQDIEMERIADVVHMGYEHFRKEFKKRNGMSPLQYRIERRMNQAKIMLLEGTTISETAQLVGYSDCYSFSKQFKKTIGLSPAAFREKND